MHTELKIVLTAVLITALVLTASVATFAQKSKVENTKPNDKQTTQKMPKRTTPEQVATYKAKAAWATEVIIKQADDMKEFHTMQAQDLATSPGAIQAYEDRLTSFALTLTTVQRELMSTATALLEAGQNQLNAAKQMQTLQGSY